MQMTGSKTVEKSPAVVFTSITSVDVLRASVPGCQEVTGSIEDGFEAVVVQRVGPVKATFKGKVLIEDAEPGKSLRLVGQGSGGVAGFASGEADVTLSDMGDGSTEVVYSVEAKVGGKLARLGGRIIDGFAKKMADQFFENLSTHLSES